MFFFITTSCGYQPIYSKNINTNNELLSISVLNIKDRPGQILRNLLISQINPENKKVITKYRLIVEIFENRSKLGYRRDMSATRMDLGNTAKYNLFDIKKGKFVVEEEVKAISSFDIVDSVYATNVAEKDARKKNLQIISDNIYTNLVVYFKSN
jgi:LPS-assembly lipoprotein